MRLKHRMSALWHKDERPLLADTVEKVADRRSRKVFRGLPYP